MFKKAILVLFILSLFLPLTAGAAELDAEARYEKWQESFEKGNVDKVIENKDYFYFGQEEINRLFKSESEKAEKPFAVDFETSLEDDMLRFHANFKKVLKGKIYLEALPLENKPGFEVLKAKYYWFRLPAKWVEKKLNQAVDEYFDFLYQDDRFKEAKVVIKNKTARLLLEFKES